MHNFFCVIANTQNIFIGGKIQKTPNIQFWHFIIYPTSDISISLLPKYTEIKKQHDSYLTDLKELKRQLDEYEREDFCNPNYNYILSKIIDKTRLTDNEKINILINYLTLSKEAFPIIV